MGQVGDHGRGLPGERGDAVIPSQDGEQPVRVLVVEPQRLVLDGLCALVAVDPGARVVGAELDGRRGLERCRELGPDVVLLAQTLPRLNGLDATRQIVEGCPDARVIALAEERSRRAVREVLRAGALGYLLRDASGDELRLAIRTVSEGHVHLSRPIVDLVVRDVLESTGGPQRGRAARLSAREREVVQLLAEGRDARQIAADLFISAKTVESHRRRIMTKLGIASVAELTKFAIREGLTPLEK